MQYRLEIDNAFGHTLRVSMTISGYDKDKPLDVAMPAWAPGAYHLTVPARNLERMDATAAGQALRMQQLDRQTWRVLAPTGVPVTVSYTCFHRKPSVVTSHVSSDYAGINGFDTFLYVVGNLGVASTVTVKPHEGWDVATALPLRDGAWFARDYDVLIDSPILWGTFQRREFLVGGKKHHLVWSGKNDFDIDRLASDTQRIVEAVWEMFGGELPYEDYWFLWRFERGAGGGLEHLNSTRINDGPTGYKDPDELDRHWGVTAHEYVHTWNVKRIRPQGLGPFDYSQEQYVTELWFSEGFTSYLGDLALVRAGIWSEERYLASLAEELESHRATPARHWMSAADSSFTTWHKSQNGVDGRVNYYNKGLLIGMLMDLELRRRSGGQYDLTDLMQRMNDDFRKTGLAFPKGTIQKIAESLTNDSWAPFFARYITGTERLAVDKALETVGMTLKKKPGQPVASLGVSTRAGEDARVNRVEDDGAAKKAGIQPGDVIISVGDRAVTGGTLASVVSDLSPGKPARVIVQRASRVLVLNVKMGTRWVVARPEARERLRKIRTHIVPRAKATPRAIAERKRWLRIRSSAAPR